MILDACTFVFDFNKSVLIRFVHGVHDNIVVYFQFIIDMDDAMSNLVQNCKSYLYLFVPISLQVEYIDIRIDVPYA